jgi:hypothetical protein
MPARARAPRPAPGRLGVLAVVVLTLLLADVLGHRPRATAAGKPPSEVLPAVVEGYASRSLPGVLGTVVARQHQVVPGLTPRAAEARAARTAAAWADNGRAAERPFPTASMVKLFLVEDVLHRVRAGDLRLRPGDRDRLRRMITESNDPAASAIWVRYDGERAVRAVARRYGLTGTAPPQVRGQWGETTTTATDLASFLTLLPVVAHPEDADRILRWMRAAVPTAADGFDQRFGLFGAAEGAGVKQGWMCCVDGKRHVHSVGVVGSTVVVLLSEVPRGVGYDAAREALTAAAAQVPLPGRP